MDTRHRALPVAREMHHDVADTLGDADLTLLERQASTIAAASPGIDELFRSIRDAVVAAHGARPTPAAIIGRLPGRLSADAFAVIRDQREAMVRAIRLREDGRLPAGVRTVWADAVGRLAAYRRGAKRELLDLRRRGLADETSRFEAEDASQAAARRRPVVNAVPSESGRLLPRVDAPPEAATLEAAAFAGSPVPPKDTDEEAAAFSHVAR